MHSFAFLLIAVATATALGLLQGVAFAMVRLVPRSRVLGLARTLSELLMQGQEMVPAVAALLVGTWAFVTYTDTQRLVGLAIVAGAVWSPIVGRAFGSRLAAELSKEYAYQAAFLGVPPIRVVASRWVLLGFRREVLGSVVTVFMYGLVADTSISFLLFSKPDLAGKTVRYYEGAVGAKLYFFMTSDPPMLVASLVGFCAVIVGLVKVVAWLEQEGPPSEARIAIRPSRGQQVLGVSLLKVDLGTPTTGGFHMELDGNAKVHVNVGELAWIRGHSGTGKSLLFKTIIEMLPRGARGVAAVDIPIHRTGKFRNVEVIFQEPDHFLYPYLRIGALARMATGDDWRVVSKDSGAEANLDRRYVDECSAGNKRMAFTSFVLSRLEARSRAAKASRTDPQLVLCDEPDASLDDVNCKKLAERLSNIINRGNVGVAYISHSPKVMRQVADRLAPGAGFVHTCESVADEVSSLTLVGSRQPLLDEDSGLEAVEFIESTKRDDGLVVQNLVVRLPGDPDRVFHFCSEPLTLGRGEKVVLRGRNGAGKSTFFKGLSGLYPSSVGNLVVNGRSLPRGETDWRTRRKWIRHVFDDAEKSLPLYLTIGEYVSQLINNATDFLEFLDEFVGRSRVGSRRPMQLSGGERQMTTFLIGFALAKAPVVLLDEPLSRLDAVRANRLLSYVFDHGQDRTVVFITHRYEEIASFGVAAVDLSCLTGAAPRHGKWT